MVLNGTGSAAESIGAAVGSAVGAAVTAGAAVAAGAGFSASFSAQATALNISRAASRIVNSFFIAGSPSISVVDYSMVRISEKPVTSKISRIISLAFFTFMVPCRFMVFWALNSIRRPAEEI